MSSVPDLLVILTMLPGGLALQPRGANEFCRDPILVLRQSAQSFQNRDPVFAACAPSPEHPTVARRKTEMPIKQLVFELGLSGKPRQNLETIHPWHFEVEQQPTETLEILT
jgi:hypothetical protein